MTTSHFARMCTTGSVQRRGLRTGQVLGAFLAVLLSAALLLHTTLTVGLGAPQRITEQEGTTLVRGFLTDRHDRHYLGLQADDRFTTVHLTLTVELLGSMDETDVTDADVTDAADEIGVNFLVLTEMGLQRFLNGADPWDVNLAAGTFAAPDNRSSRADRAPEGLLDDRSPEREILQLEARFRAVGRGGYTVLVYNTGDLPAIYQLQAEGGQLIDGAGQTHPAHHRHPLEALNREGYNQGISLNNPAAERFGHAAPTLTALPVASLGRPASRPVRAASLSGHLTGEPTEHMDGSMSGSAGGSAVGEAVAHADVEINAAHTARHYFVLEPTAHNGEMTLSLAYQPAYQSADQSDPASRHDTGIDSDLDIDDEPAFPADGINYWVFTEAGVRQLDQGAPAEFLSLASGVSFLGVPNLLRTQVRLTGETPYVVVVYNDTAQPVDYRLRVEGGNLVDLYSQSKEAHSTGPDRESAESRPESTEPVPDIAGQPQERWPKDLFPESLLPPSIAKQLESAPQSEQGEENTQDHRPNQDTDGVAAEPDTSESAASESPLEEPTPEEQAPQEIQTFRLPLYHVEFSDKWLAPRRTQDTAHLVDIALDAGMSRQWTVQPDGAFSRVVVTLEAPDSQNRTQATSLDPAPMRDIRIWIVSKEGLRRVEAGVTPAQATVAGFSTLRLGRDAGILQASFDPVGYEAYTVIVENLGEQTMAFDLNARNGVFISEDAHSIHTPHRQ